MIIIINSKTYGRKEVLIDDKDYDIVKDHIWSLNKKYHRFYAETRINGKLVRMHRLIMNCTDPKIQVDHINHDGLDNRRGNLRFATGTQNLGNKRKHKKNV